MWTIAWLAAALRTGESRDGLQRHRCKLAATDLVPLQRVQKHDGQAYLHARRTPNSGDTIPISSIRHCNTLVSEPLLPPPHREGMICGTCSASRKRASLERESGVRAHFVIRRGRTPRPPPLMTKCALTPSFPRHNAIHSVRSFNRNGQRPARGSQGERTSANPRRPLALRLNEGPRTLLSWRVVVEKTRRTDPVPSPSRLRPFSAI